ncbi:MAG: LemA family protein [Coriobacteriia bacterium]
MMSGGILICAGAFVVIIVLALAVVAIYNRLVLLRNRVDNAWSQIDVQLKRRYDLIPNLVETVKGYAKHESGVFERVTAARSAAMGAQGVEQRAEAENMLTGALKTLFAVAEAYPELKANTNFLQLQDQLADTENKIAYSRQFYNDTVMTYNTATQTFPNNVLAGMFGFKAREYFEAEPAVTEAPTVAF